MEIPLIRMASSSVAQVMMPEVSTLYKDGKYQQAIDLFRRGTFKTALVLMPLTGLLFVIAPGLMVVLYGPRFAASAVYFQIYLILVPFKSILYTMLFQAAGRTDLVFYRASLNLFLNTTLTILLIREFGPVGAAVGTVISTVCIAMPYELVTCSRLYRTSIAKLLPYWSLLKLVLLIGGVALLSHYSTYWWTQDRPFLLCLIGGGVFGALAVPTMYVLYRNLFGFRKVSG